MTAASFTLLTFLATLCLLFNHAAAFSQTFPTGNDYWTACKTNTLKWTVTQGEAEIFSVALLNSNNSLLNGNYQIANSVPSVNGTFAIHLNCVPPADGYYLNFVNSSHYSLNNPQVYYTSPTFTIRDNTSTVLDGSSSTSGNGSSSSPSSNSTTNPSNTFQSANPATNSNPVDTTKNANSALNVQVSGAIVVLLSMTIAAHLLII